MFEYVREETLIWFDKNPLECGLNFELVGMLLGLSIYNNVNLDLHFPIVIYKKLMDQSVCIAVPTLNISDGRTFMRSSQSCATTSESLPCTLMLSWTTCV